MSVSIPPYARNLLTPRELEIILLLPASNSLIARRFSLSKNSVKRHIMNIRHKFDIPSRQLLIELTPQILASQAPLPGAVICPNCGSIIDPEHPHAANTSHWLLP
jgi:DNA-binding CsgD family transcriptional regulator